MKRLLCLALTLTLLLSMACVSTASAENVTFDWFITASALPSTWDLDQPIFKAITDATGCTPSVSIPAEDADTKLNLMMVNGDLPDLITMNNDDLTHELIQAGLVWDLGEFMQTYMPESHILKDYPQDVKNEVTRIYNGWYFYSSHMKTEDGAAIWGYPAGTEEYYEAQKYSDQFSIFINAAVAKQLNIDVKAIDTEEKLMEVMAQIDAANLTNDSGASVNTLVIPSDAWVHPNMEALKYQFGTMPYDEEGKYRSEWYAPQYRHSVEFLNKCYELGYLDQNVLTMDETTMRTLCNSNRAAVYIGGIAALKMGHDDEWGTPGPILSSAGDSPVFPKSTQTGIGWLRTFVSKSCENPEAIAKFIDYMSSREGMLMHMYGVEGTDFVWDDQGMLHRTDIGKSKVEDGVTSMYGFYAFHYTNFSNSVEYVDVANASDILTSLGTSDKVYKYDSSLMTLPSGYVEAGSDYAFIKTEVSNYVQSNMSKIIMAKDKDTFNTMYDSFLAQLDAMGLREYDAYLNLAVQKNAADKGVDLKKAQPGQ